MTPGYIFGPDDLGEWGEDALDGAAKILRRVANHPSVPDEQAKAAGEAALSYTQLREEQLGDVAGIEDIQQLYQSVSQVLQAMQQLHTAEGLVWGFGIDGNDPTDVSTTRIELLRADDAEARAPYEA